MPKTIFISYAGNDPEWPEAAVRAMATEFEQLGATVLLDVFHLERQAEPGKLSLSEWRDWMKAGLKEADRVVCLVSARYREAVDRNLGETWGYGVAYESLKLLATLYRQKGHSNKRILTVRPDGAPREHIPEDFQDPCPEYQWPKERQAVLEHVSGIRLQSGHAQGQKGASQQPSGTGQDAPNGARLRIDDPGSPGLRHQAQHALKMLEAQRTFFNALVGLGGGALGDLDSPPPTDTPLAFVQWLLEADQPAIQAVMWEVRTVLEQNTGFTRSAEAQAAAVSVYMLCALRWVNTATIDAKGSVIKVPDLGANILAVLSAALLGGRVEYAPQAGIWQPLHVYHVRHAKGVDDSANLLRAIFCSLFAEDPAALDIARRDDDDPIAASSMLQRIRSRLSDVRGRQRLSFTLVIDQPDAFHRADWAPDLKVSPFSIDSDLSNTLFIAEPHFLDEEIRALLKMLRASNEGAPP